MELSANYRLALMSRVGLSSQDYAPGRGRAEPLDHPVMKQQAFESARGMEARMEVETARLLITIALLTALSLAGRQGLSDFK